MKNKMTKHKSYNPLKMWLAWVGAGVGILSYLQASIINTTFCPKLNFLAIPFSNAVICSESLGNYNVEIMGIPYYVYYPLLVVSLFLVGWGIQSLFRRFIR